MSFEGWQTYEERQFNLRVRVVTAVLQAVLFLVTYCVTFRLVAGSWPW